ncbi:glycosyltransferase [Agromyces humatus]|uniref:Glycosyltransferase n=1 Tax=Agromyces humatus TaxID=279573 RepID=A0ABP4X4V5_9MICO|nr:glycosyltransferase [Agromyces humatus]
MISAAQTKRFSAADGREPLVTVIVPTRNEAGNIAPLLERIGRSRTASSFEVLFVDDSDDATPERVAEYARDGDVPIRIVHRAAGERVGGLGGAVLTGLRVARGCWAVIMDGDLQHPPELAVPLAEVGISRGIDLVMATRRVGSGDASGLGSRSRRVVSQVSNRTAKLIFPRSLGPASDPMSGFFAVRIDALDLDELRPRGFKILMELLVRTPDLRIAEVPFTMAERNAGTSKASLTEGTTFLGNLLRLRFRGFTEHTGGGRRANVLVRGLLFGLVGLSGILVNTAVLWYFSIGHFEINYLVGAIIATEASTLWLFLLTETLVYHGDKPGSGLSRGARFFLINHIGLAIRLPLLALLVNVAGMAVLWANLVTLLVTFALRFFVTDSTVYGAKVPHDDSSHEYVAEPIRIVVNLPNPAATSPTPATPSLSPTPDRSRHLPYRYAIPSVVTIGSQVELPELEYFRAQWLGNDTEIQVRIGHLGARTPRLHATATQLASPPGMGYTEHLGSLSANFRVEIGDLIEVVVSPSLAHSPHVVYTNVIEALLRFEAVSKGSMLLHSACLELQGTGILISARTDTGKTGTVLRMVRERGARFLSDDMTILHADGSVECFPKPLTISRHTLRAVASNELTKSEWRHLRLQSRLHSKEGREFALLLAKMNIPIMGVNAMVQRVVPPPKFAIDRLLSCNIIASTKVSELFIIERGPEEQHDLALEETVDTLLANTEDAYQFPPFRQLAPSIVIGEVDHQVMRAREREILTSALGVMHHRTLSSPHFGWADDIPELLASERAAAKRAKAAPHVPDAARAAALTS